AFNLAWKLALVHHGAADQSLLDSYQIERRPAAEIVTQSGDAFEHALTMTNQAERESLDEAIRTKLADPNTRHHEIVAETELNVDYSKSPIVSGYANGRLAPGQRLLGTIVVKRSNGQSCRLHELSHRAGHTLMLLAGPSAHFPAVIDLHAV